MKRKNLIEVILLFALFIALSISIYFVYYFFNPISDLKELVKMYSTMTGSDYSAIIHSLNKSIRENIIRGILMLLSSLLLCLSIVLIAIKDFPVFKPLLDKVNARREQRAQAKTEKAEADKQQKLKKLQAKIDKLKNN